MSRRRALLCSCRRSLCWDSLQTSRPYPMNSVVLENTQRGTGFGARMEIEHRQDWTLACQDRESWLSKVIYNDWLSKEYQDIHSARCRACCKSIKLQTMGEAALTSHAGGSGHKAAVRKMREAGNMNATAQTNGSVKWTEDSKEQVALCLQRDPLDRIMSNDWSNLNPTTNSAAHNAAELQDVTFPTAFLTAPGTSQVVIQRLHPTAGGEAEGATRRSSLHDPADLSREEHQQRADALEQQQRADALEQQMKVLEWENRMKVLAWEQELVMEKRRAARQKEKAFRMKKTYYRAKLKRMGEDVPPSTSSSSDEEAKTYGPSG